MHLVISHASAPGPRCRAASACLVLPQLQALLRRSGAVTLQIGQADSLTPLAEHVAAGGIYPDGLIPWAAWLAQESDLFQSGQHWALISPCDLQVHSDHVAMRDPSLLDLGDEDSRALLGAMQPYFEEDGIALHWHSAGTWLAQGQVFKDLPSASINRVRGQAIDAWIPRQSAAQGLRRLQNEMQMLLYTHPLNDARSARGQAPVNGFWISGTGSPAHAQTPKTQADVPSEIMHASASFSGKRSPHALLVDSLTASALQDDAQTWTQLWQMLDSELLASLTTHRTGATEQALSITLCGNERARRFDITGASLWLRIRQQFTAPAISHFVQDL